MRTYRRGRLARNRRRGNVDGLDGRDDRDITKGGRILPLVEAALGVMVMDVP